MTLETLSKLIAALTPNSPYNTRRRLRNKYKERLSEETVIQELKKIYPIKIKRNRLIITVNQDNREELTRFHLVVFGGTIEGNTYKNTIIPRQILHFADRGHNIKGLRTAINKQKSPCSTLTTDYSKILSDEQVRFVEAFKKEGRLLMSHDMGKGKTPSTIVCCKERGVKKVIIATTKSTIPNWIDEWYKFGLLVHEKDNRLNIAEIHKGLGFMKKNDPRSLTLHTNRKTLNGQWIGKITNMTIKEKLEKADVILITHASLTKLTELLTFLEKECRSKIDTLVIDEAHLVANMKTQKGKKLYSMNDHYTLDNVLLLTGTPITKISVDEIIFYTNLLYHNIVNGDVMRQMFIKRINKDKGFYHVEHLRKLLLTIAPHRLKWDKNNIKEQGLGQLLINKVYCETDLQQQITFIDNSNKNPLVKLQEKTALFAPYKKQKAKELIDQALQNPHKKIVVFSYLNEVLKELHQEYDSVLLTGSSPKRGELINRFKTDPHCRVFFGNIKAAGIGINLQNADYSIIIEPGYSSEKVQQAISRTHRRGNNSPVVTVDLIFMKGETVEERKETIINKKANAASVIVDGVRHTVTGINENSGIIIEQYQSNKPAEDQQKIQHWRENLLLLNEPRNKLIAIKESKARETYQFKKAIEHQLNWAKKVGYIPSYD
ncbi:MAG: helicase-related protein [Brevinema sp.]